MGASHGAGSDDPLTLLRELTEAVRDAISHGGLCSINGRAGWFMFANEIIDLNDVLRRCEAAIRSGPPVALSASVRPVLEAALRRPASPREMKRAMGALSPPDGRDV